MTIGSVVKAYFLAETIALHLYGMPRILNKFNSIFPNGKFILPNSFSLITTKIQGNWISYSLCKTEMWPALFYVSSLYFQQRNSNWGMAFLNLSLDSKLGFFNVGLRLYFFLIHKKIENWDFWILLYRSSHRSVL